MSKVPELFTHPDPSQIDLVLADEFASLMTYVSEMSAELASMARLAGNGALAAHLERARYEALASLDARHLIDAAPDADEEKAA